MKAEMESNNNISLEMIELYLEGKLSIDEKNDFEKMFTDRSILSENINSYKTLVGGIKSVQRKKMLFSLQEEDEKMPAVADDVQKSKTIVFNNFSRELFYWAVAAVVLLILVPVYYNFRQDQKTELLFSQYFSPHQENDNIIKVPSADVMQEYREGDYAEALQLLNKAQRFINNNDTIEASNLFYKGNMYLATEKPQEAIGCFEKILKNPSQKYIKESEWYLALSYLKVNQSKKAKPYIEKIARDSENPFQKEASDLLHKM